MNNSWLLLTAAGTYILGLLSGYFNRLFNLFIVTLRVKNKNALAVYKYVCENARFKFNFTESLALAHPIEIPEHENSVCLLHGIPMSMDVGEKYLTAGSQSKEEQMFLSFFRWNKKKLNKLLQEIYAHNPERSFVKVFLSRWSYFKEVMTLNKENYQDEIFLSDDVKIALDKFLSSKRNRAGILLYGPPGNGKTSLIRKLACDKDMDIYIPVFRPDMSNDDIVNIFTEVPADRPTMIVLEDFDSLFYNRVPVNKDTKFSFEAFLNILDGLYFNRENRLILMTANDIDSVDRAIKNRPSRFDMVLKIDNPTLQERRKILNHYRIENAEEIAHLTEGRSAAIVAELGKRQPQTLVDAQAIINSFIEEEADKSPNLNATRLITQKAHVVKKRGRWSY